MALTSFSISIAPLKRASSQSVDQSASNVGKFHAWHSWRRQYLFFAIYTLTFAAEVIDELKLETVLKPENVLSVSKGSESTVFRSGRNNQEARSGLSNQLRITEQFSRALTI